MEPEKKKQKLIVPMNFPNRPEIAKSYEPNFINVETNHFLVDIGSIK